MVVEQPPGQFVQQRGLADAVQVLDREIVPSPMIPWLCVMVGPTDSG